MKKLNVLFIMFLLLSVLVLSMLPNKSYSVTRPELPDSIQILSHFKNKEYLVIDSNTVFHYDKYNWLSDTLKIQSISYVDSTYQISCDLDTFYIWFRNNKPEGFKQKGRCWYPIR